MKFHGFLKWKYVIIKWDFRWRTEQAEKVLPSLLSVQQPPLFTEHLPGPTAAQKMIMCYVFSEKNKTSLLNITLVQLLKITIICIHTGTIYHRINMTVKYHRKM